MERTYILHEKKVQGEGMEVYEVDGILYMREYVPSNEYTLDILGDLVKTKESKDGRVYFFKPIHNKKDLESRIGQVVEKLKVGALVEGKTLRVMVYTGRPGFFDLLRRKSRGFKDLHLI